MSDNIFRKAAEILKTRGWITGDYFNAEGCCLVGACTIAAGLPEDVNGPGRFEGSEECELLEELVCRGSITAWNDDQEGPEPVLRLLETAAVEWEARNG